MSERSNYDMGRGELFLLLCIIGSAWFVALAMTLKAARDEAAEHHTELVMMLRHTQAVIRASCRTVERP